ncbi:MAG TPA: type IV secretory system conjugative DNA transfer family protein [Candidatus Rubneribacter avistercoris]|nr:type IV secretory system conjugative DNA transfer family protein [Candidatus Rubneribacter avistercoris]
MNALLWVLWSLCGGTLAGWLANRVASYYADNPISFDANFSIDPLIEGMARDPLWLDPRFMWAFWAALALVMFAGMATYDYGGERRRAREVKGKEYGEAAWATENEMAAFAHLGTVTHVKRTLPEQPRARRAALLRDPRAFVLAKLGIAVKKPNPKPEWCDRMEDDNIILSETARLQLSKIPDPLTERNKHVLVIGGSGSGKTFNYVGPNLLQLYGSYVVTDPKGDTLKQYGNFFLRHGYDLKVVALKDGRDLTASMHYNPLMYITDSTSIIQIVNLLVENTTGEGKHPDANEDYFVKAERQLYMALIGYLHFFYADQPEARTFNEMVNLLQMTEGEEAGQSVSPLDILMFGYEGATPEESFVGYKQWCVKRHGSEEAARRSDEWFVLSLYKGFKSTARSPETEASVISSCHVRMAPFSVGSVKDFFSEDELELDKIGERKTAFFLVMSDTDSTFNFILAMLLYQLFDRNTAIADRNPGSHCKLPVVCILDELANIGRIPDLEKKIATLRSRWIYLHPIMQNAAQLKGLYGDKAPVIEGNCDTNLYLGRSDFETNKHYSEKLGKYTEVVRNRSESRGRQGGYSDSETRIARDLLSASDLSNNPDKFAGDDCLVFINGARPFKDKKYKTLDHPRYRELAEAGEFVLEDWRYDKEREKRAELRLIADEEIAMQERMREFMGGVREVYVVNAA